MTNVPMTKFTLTIFTKTNFTNVTMTNLTVTNFYKDEFYKDEFYNDDVQNDDFLKFDNTSIILEFLREFYEFANQQNNNARRQPPQHNHKESKWHNHRACHVFNDTSNGNDLQRGHDKTQSTQQQSTPCNTSW